MWDFVIDMVTEPVEVISCVQYRYGLQYLPRLSGWNLVNGMYTSSERITSSMQALFLFPALFCTV